MRRFELIAPCHFGMEAVLKREIDDLGYDITEVADGRVTFYGDEEALCRANIFLRTAERILIKIGSFHAETFEELFQLVKSIAWEELLPRNARFPVTGKCARSQLMSVRDCQAITKKAIVERLRHAWRVDWLPETGVTYPLDVSLHGDVARITLDACGEALNRRGYRTWNGEAPLRLPIGDFPVAARPCTARPLLRHGHAID